MPHRDVGLMPATHVPIEVVVAEYERWTATARTGRITLEFSNGVCAMMERTDKLSLPVGTEALPVSPCCLTVMAWSDYNMIGTCKCGKTWNVFKAKREMAMAKARSMGSA